MESPLTSSTSLDDKDDTEDIDNANAKTDTVGEVNTNIDKEGGNEEINDHEIEDHLNFFKEVCNNDDSFSGDREKNYATQAL